MEQLNVYRAQFEKELDKIDALVLFETKTKVPKLYLIGAVAVVALALVFMNMGAALITNLVGFVYPSYASFKAIESKSSSDDTLWLTYWVVFSFLSILEFFIEWILFWLPFYYVLKLVFLAYLMNPTAKGAEVIYTNFLRPLLLKNEKVIDKKLENLQKKASSSSEQSAKAVDDAMKKAS